MKIVASLVAMLLAPLAVYAVTLSGAGAADVDTCVLSSVNPFVGTANYGACNPGALVPNGLMSVSPFNVTGSPLNRFDKDERWWSTPYDATNSYMTGFSHVNLSGVGCPETGSVLTMATAGPLDVDYHSYGSAYGGEIASPGYYAVRFTAHDILAEVTATPRTSVERFTFDCGGQGNILVNLGVGLTNETGGWLRRIDDTTIAGSRLMGTFCYNPDAVFVMYFAVRVDRSPSRQGFWKFQPQMQGVESQWTPDDGTYKVYNSYAREMGGDDIGYYFSYDDLEPGEQVCVSVGVSFVSADNALLNLNTEQAVIDFDATHAAARARWAGDLSRVIVEGGTAEQRRVFYTALYHSLIHPNILQDVNGEYPRAERGDNGVTSRDRYTVFSLWDTYRNLHQLLTLLYPRRQSDMVDSMVGIYRDWGWMPKWELYGRETFTMEGDPATCVIVDTWRKGIRDFDIDTAYEAMCRSAMLPGADNLMRPDIDPYVARGYIPVGYYSADASGDNSVSHALEYYVADNALSALAEERADTLFAGRLRERSLGYRHYYSAETGTLRPLNADGSFINPFDPHAGANFEAVPGFHEGSAYNYTYAVPHDIDGLAGLMGGPDILVDSLQQVFDRGLYDPANEPDINYPYIFARFKGHEWRTDSIVARLLADHYADRPDGLPGNDDAGTMSAWAVWSMLGLYPDTPGEPHYTLVRPTFSRATLRIPAAGACPAHTLVIERRGDGPVRQILTDGRLHDSRRITHDELMNARSIQFDCQSVQSLDPAAVDHEHLTADP